jgi:hypothetical protein
MVLVELLRHAAGEEIVVGAHVVPLIPGVLLLPAMPVPVVHQPQDQVDPSLLCFGYYEV